LVPVPPISNNTTAIPAVVLTVNLFLFIHDNEPVRKYIRSGGQITQNQSSTLLFTIDFLSLVSKSWTIHASVIML
ncbi:MAG: hypothetical protein QN632_00105, partial [Nitrososphaeraceae archaeon]|nr:hypothetical protein [Nitrososphaeraceae archaeon]